MAITFASNTLISSGDMSSSFQSDIISLVNKKGFSIHSVFTGSPVGSMYLAVSIDNTNWIVLEDSPQAITEAGDIFFNVSLANYLSARLHYTRSSGSGTCNSTFSVKE